MADIIVQSSRNVLLAGAGQASKGDLQLALEYASYLVAADGGAELLRNYGKTPRKVIGDLDSIDRASLDAIPENHRIHVREQETTDFEKCLQRIRAPLIVGVGFLGGRVDHELAVLNALARYPGGACVLIGAKDVVFHAPGRLMIDLPEGSRLSLFPLADIRGESAGLEWPIAGIEFAPGGFASISNRVERGPVKLAFDRPGMLVILPRSALGEAVRALLPAG